MSMDERDFLKNYQELEERMDEIEEIVRQLYLQLNKEVAEIIANSDYANNADFEGADEFFWSEHPELQTKIEKVQKRFVHNMEKIIYSGTSKEWANSNLVQDLLARDILGKHIHQSGKKKYTHIYQKNNDALKAFQQRKISKAGTLSQNLWKQSQTYLDALEAAISCAVEKGVSARTLSKKISQYLKDFDSLRADYTERYGKATRAKDCEYRSMRLARSEINMAYRTAEQTRWQQMDFIVGYEIKPSHQHRVKDICDDLAGKYPKDFKWVGWHPACTDYCIPIIKTEQELWDEDDNLVSVNQVNEVPNDFKKWVKDNRDRITKASRRGTLPYYLRDNRKLVNSILKNK